MLDQLDNLVDSEVMSENIDYYAQDSTPQARSLEETAGIPTGVAPDLAAAIARKQARRATTVTMPAGAPSIQAP